MLKKPVSGVRVSSKPGSTTVEVLEPRRMLAGQPFGTFTNGALVIEGTTGNDTVGFRTSGARTLVRLNGVLGKFTTANFTRIEVQTYDGADVVDFSAMTMPCYVNLGVGNDLAYGGSGKDTLTGAAGKDTLYGNAGNDRLAGGNTSDQIYGGEGDDAIYGGFGDDYVDGGSGRDHLFGEDGIDTLIGGASSDGIYGGAGSDKIYGQAGNDVLSGEGGNDRIYGGDGNDNIVGGPGKNYLYGEAGDDTIDAKNGVADAVVDGGTGTDTVLTDASLETAISAEVLNVDNGGGGGTTPDPVDPPVVPIGGSLDKAISFGDEALWDENFSSMVAKVKALGVNTVRVWLEVSNFAERPHAYDNVSNADLIKNWRKTTPEDQRAITAGLAMKRVFDLKAAGFKVILTVTPHDAHAEASANAADFYRYLLAQTKTPTSTMTMKDAVDFWEVSQEVDLASNWKPSGVDKVAGLQQYVDTVLIPAAEVLHSGPTSTWEKVISASVSYQPTDLKTILTELQTQGKLGDIDYAGYHPYGQYNVAAGVDQLKDRVVQAAAVAKSFNKPMAATEWNVRGYAPDGSQDAAWATAIGQVFSKYIAPNFGIAVYYTIIDNYDARGANNTSARPAGLFSHDTDMTVTPTSSTEDLEAYYATPLVMHQPFYDAFKNLADA